MSRLCSSVAFVVLTAIGSCSPAPAADERPNIVFILADDLAWSDPACYGNPIHDTPNIDRLAREGTRFTQGYAPAPICSASRAAILTGKTPARLNFEFVTKTEPGRQQLKVPLQSPPFTLDLPLDEFTLGEALSSAGYTTGFFGKWHVSRHHQGYLGWSPTHGPLQQGFGEGNSDFGSHPYSYRTAPEQKTQPVTNSSFPDDSLTDAAIDFMERRRGRSFFLYLSQYYVHDPVHTRCDWLIEKYRQRVPTDTPDVRASYAAMVETLDHLVGRVLMSLDDLGLTDSTLIVFMSDNGGHPNYTSNAPLRGSKWNLYEGGIRVPFIVRWPGHVRPGTECDMPVHGCDLFPTFCDVAAFEPPADPRDGITLLPLLTDPSAEMQRSTPLVWHFPYYHPEKGFQKAPQSIGIADFQTSQTRPHSAIRVDQWKLLHFYEDDRLELYNLQTDIAEQQNVATTHRDVAQQLDTRLNEYLRQAKARFPTGTSE